jgi:alcohol dehydrogenase
MESQILYNRLEDLDSYISKRENTSIFLVRGKSSFTTSGAEEKLEKILSNTDVTHFYGFSPNPKLEDAVKGIELYKQTNPNLILAIGGGSSIDMAKLIKGLSNQDFPRESILQNKISGSNIPLIAAPTTSGSGSESTPFAVVYIDGTKYSLFHETLLPNQIVLDPTLTHSLSNKLTAVTGLDALAQAIESYWSVNSTTESQGYSKLAINNILPNIENTVNDPNPINRQAMMLGSNYAGKAIGIAKTTSCHSISYPITFYYGIPHGHAVALTLGDILEYNSNLSESDCMDVRGIDYTKGTMQELNNILGVDSATEAKDKIKSLVKSIGLETRFSDLGISDLDMQDILEKSFNPQRMKNNPRLIREGDLRNILEQIY